MIENQETKHFTISKREPPERFQNQLNGRTAQENYRTMKQKAATDFFLSLYKSRRRAEIDREIEQEIERELPPKIEQAIDDILKTLEKGI